MATFIICTFSFFSLYLYNFVLLVSCFWPSAATINSEACVKNLFGGPKLILLLFPIANDAHRGPLELKKLNRFCIVSKNLDMLGETFETSDITKFKL